MQAASVLARRFFARKEEARQEQEANRQFMEWQETMAVAGSIAVAIARVNPEALGREPVTTLLRELGKIADSQIVDILPSEQTAGGSTVES